MSQYIKLFSNSSMLQTQLQFCNRNIGWPKLSTPFIKWPFYESTLCFQHVKFVVVQILNIVNVSFIGLFLCIYMFSIALQQRPVRNRRLKVASCSVRYTCQILQYSHNCHTPTFIKGTFGETGWSDYSFPVLKLNKPLAEKHPGIFHLSMRNLFNIQVS